MPPAFPVKIVGQFHNFLLGRHTTILAFPYSSWRHTYVPIASCIAHSSNFYVKSHIKITILLIFRALRNKVVLNGAETAALLEWSNGIQKRIELEKISDDDCIFKSYFFEEIDSSNILLTGCKDETRDIQIQSLIFGDTLATFTDDGNVELHHGSLLRDEIVSNPEFFLEFFKPETMQIHQRGKRDLNYISELPEYLSLNLNIYKSSSWISGTQLLLPVYYIEK